MAKLVATALLLVFATASLVAGNAAWHPPRNRSPPPAGPAPSTCRFFPATTTPNGTVTSPSKCFMNADWSLTLLSTVGRTGSPQARSEILFNQMYKACSVYNVTNYGANWTKVCQADHENRCITAFGSCISYANVYLPPKLVYCKGSNWWKFTKCNSFYKDECDADSDCVWSENLYYGGAQFVEAKKNASLANGDGPLDLGACYWKKYIDYVLAPNGSVAHSGADTFYWGAENIGSSSNNLTTWQATRGTCDYANKLWARYQYQKSCAALNTVADGRSMEVNATDYSTLAKCESLGCVVQWRNNIYSINQGANMSMSGFACTTNTPYLDVTMTYDSVKDNRYADARIQCFLPAAQISEANCLAVKV